MSPHISELALTFHQHLLEIPKTSVSMKAITSRQLPKIVMKK